MNRPASRHQRQPNFGILSKIAAKKRADRQASDTALEERGCLYQDPRTGERCGEETASRRARCARHF